MLMCSCYRADVAFACAVGTCLPQLPKLAIQKLDESVCDAWQRSSALGSLAIALEWQYPSYPCLNFVRGLNPPGFHSRKVGARFLLRSNSTVHRPYPIWD